MTNTWPATQEEIEEAITAQAEPIWEKCPTCNDGDIETGQLGIWSLHENVPVDDVRASVATAQTTTWVRGFLGGWYLHLTDEVGYRLEPPPTRLAQFKAQRLREQAQEMLERAERTTS